MLNTPSSLVSVISRQKRTQRRQRMQRSWSSTMRGPMSLRFSSLRRGSCVRVCAAAVGEGVVLQQALAGLVADRAIERMVDQQQLHHAAPRVLHRRRVGAHHHAVADRRVAGDHQLGAAFDLDLAHAAAAVDRQLRVPAVVRDVDAVLERDRQQHGAVRRLDRLAVDGDRGHRLPPMANGERWIVNCGGTALGHSPFNCTIHVSSQRPAAAVLLGSGRPPRSFCTRSCSLMSASSTASGRGGQPGM